MNMEYKSVKVRYTKFKYNATIAKRAVLLFKTIVFSTLCVNCY